jgi:hypothetical protein
MWRDLWARACSPFREFGAGAGSLYVIDRVLRRVSPSLGLQVYEFMVQPIGTTRLLPPGLSKNLVAEEIGQGHPAVAEMPARADIKQARFEHGARCLGVYRKGQLLGYSWFTRDRYEEDEVRCTYLLEDRAASIFDFDLYVLPQYRLGIGFLGVWHMMNETLAPQGVRYTFSRLTRFNLASRRAHAHLGWKRVGSAVFVQAWRTELMLATMAPWVALTWKPGQRVQLRLRPDVLQSSGTPAGDVMESSR